MERFLDYFAPEKYELDLTIDRTHETTHGTVTIAGVAHAQQIKLHAVEMQISAVTCAEQECHFNYDGETLSIDLPEKPAESATLKIDFDAPMRHDMQGCYLSTYEFAGAEKRIATTQFESHYARQAFPCVDEPAAKAKFQLTLRVPDLAPEDVALANTPLVESADSRFVFAETPPMSTYLLAWVVGPLHSVSTTNAHGVLVSSYAALNQPLKSLEFANDVAARALDYYDEKFHERYPLPKLDQVAIPDFEAGAMENWGLVTYRESCLLADATASIDSKKSIALTVTHELAHQWFGNLVTMAWWDDLWLNESFASVIEFFATDALFPKYDIWQEFFTDYCFAALKRDSLPGVQSVQQAVHHPAEIATLFDSAIVYAKGAHLIFMLIRLMNTENFDQGICAYFQKHKYSNTVGDDLWEALQPYADLDVKNFMHAWISQPGFPVVEYASGGVKQKRFLITGETDDTVWPLPEVTDDMSGHYLINLHDAEFQNKIAQFDELSREQKLRLLIDRELLAKTPSVPSSSLLDLLPKFVHDDSAAVWNVLAILFSDLKLFCPPETPAAENYKKFLRDLLAEQFAAIDFAALDDANALLRREFLLGLAHYSEHEPTLRRLAAMYQDDFAKIDPELRTQILAAKLYFDEAEVFAPWLEKYPRATDPEIKNDILYALANFAKEPQHLDELLGLLEQPKIVRSQNHIFLFVHLMRNFRTRERTLDWLISHWDYIEKLTGEKSIEDYPRYAAGIIRDEKEAQKFYAFFDTKLDDPVLSRTLKIAHTDIDARLRLIAADAEAVQAKLFQSSSL